MRKSAYFTLFFTVALAVVVMFAATEVMAQIDTCQNSNGKITINLIDITSDGSGNTVYIYEMVGHKATLKKANRVVGVATRPISPDQFLPPAPDYGEPDTATKLCTGDMDSFCTSHEPQVVTSSRKTFSVTVTPDTLQGRWTLNVILGKDGVNTCVTQDGVGITGPGCLDCGPVPEFATYSVPTEQVIEAKGGYKFKVRCDPKTGDCEAYECYKPLAGGGGFGWQNCTKVPMEQALTAMGSGVTKLSEPGGKGKGFLIYDDSPSSPWYYSGGYGYY